MPARPGIRADNCTHTWQESTEGIKTKSKDYCKSRHAPHGSTQDHTIAPNNHTAAPNNHTAAPNNHTEATKTTQQRQTTTHLQGGIGTGDLPIGHLCRQLRDERRQIADAVSVRHHKLVGRHKRSGKITPNPSCYLTTTADSLSIPQLFTFVYLAVFVHQIGP